MNINLQAPINFLSYGIVGQYLTSELCKQGHNISLFPIGNRVDVNDIQNINNISYIQKCINNSYKFNRNAISLRLFHAFSLAEQIGSPKVGFPIFELNRFNDIEYTHLSNCDVIVVPSKWAKTVIEAQLHGSTCEVCPLGVDTNIFYPSNNINSAANKEKTIFLSIGKHELRKGHAELCTAFNAAFEPHDDVELWLSHHNFFLKPEQQAEWERLFLESKMGAQIKFIPRLTKQSELCKLINDTDALISLSRAEGWNLPLLEGMACGKQIIATNYSAHTEFCNNDNAMLIDIDELEMAYDGIWFDGKTGQWAAINDNQINAAVEYMRKIHHMKQSGQSLVNNSGLDTAKKYSWENMGRILVNILSNVS